MGYTMLIVDNEKIIADGLWEYFSEMAELDVHVAYSGKQAIELLEQIPMDIVLSDIHMPGIDGLELQQEIVLRWPRCKVIFLSGYDEFAYAHQALRYRASNYILKTEGYEVIADAVVKIMDELDETNRFNNYLSDARKQWQTALPILQKDLMQRVLAGDSLDVRALSRQLGDCRIDLLADEPVLLMIGRVDEWRETDSLSDQTLLMFAIRNITEEFLQPSMRIFGFALDNSRIVWMMQPAEAPPKAGATPEEDVHMRHLRFVQLTLTDIQTACSNLLRIPLSLDVGRDFVSWDKLSEQFELLKQESEALFQVKSRNRSEQEQELVSRIRTYVANHLGSDLTLSKVGEVFEQQPYYLSRIYKQATGQGLADYMADARFHKAKTLLQDSSLRIHEISEAVGFLSEKYFYRFFKKKAGITPQEYRDNHK